MSGIKGAEEPQTKQQPTAELKPATITVSGRGTFLAEADMIKYVMEPVKKKYPHIAVQIAPFTGGTAGIQELLAAGKMPDVIIPFYENLSLYNDMNVMEPLDPLMKKHQFDIKRVDEGAIATIKAMSSPDKLVGLPLTALPGALYYNKDLFDSFGVPYPKDGMSLQQVSELGKN